MPNFSIADILARSEENRAKMPMTGIGAALPVIGNLAIQGAQQYGEAQKQRSVMQAQKDYADFLSLPDEEKKKPQNAAKGYQAALSLGINPMSLATKQTSGITDPQLVDAYRKSAGIDGPISGTKENVAALEKLASLKKPAKIGATDLTPDEQAALDKALDEKRLNPKQIVRGPKLKALARHFLANPKYNAMSAEIDFGAGLSGAEAGARLTQGGSAQVVARVAQSAEEQLSTLQEASDKFNRSDIKFLNTPIIYLAKQNYPEAQNWLIAIGTARAEYATALNRGNSPSEVQLKEAQQALPDNITPKQLPGAIKQLRKGLQNTVRGMMTPASSRPDQSQYAPPASGGKDPLGLGI